ncbi:MAG: electron transport complex subunit E [Bacilli bacterium]|nr:electron transport complex subunit E [Bacilli bacterium]
MKKFDIFKRGLFVENPVFVLLLGLCSTLAITTNLTNAVGMGVAVIAVLLMSNIIISLLRNIIPDEIRIPVFIVIIATLVKCVQMIMNAYTPALYESLGVFIPLIVVNCIILGRAESFASKNGVIDSIFDALGMGVGYLFAVLVMSFFRELIGTGGVSLLNPFDTTQVIFDIKIFADYAVSLFTQPAGAFITLGCILAFIQLLNVRKANKAKEAAKKEGGK